MARGCARSSQSMRNCGFVGVGVLGLVLCGTASSAQDLGRYREFELGNDVTVVSTVAGTAASDLKVIQSMRCELVNEFVGERGGWSFKASRRPGSRHREKH